MNAHHRTKHHAPTSKVRRDLNCVIGTWNRDHRVLLLRLLLAALLNILPRICLSLWLTLRLLLARRRRLTRLLRLLLRDILLLALSRHLGGLLLRWLRRSQWNLNVCARNR
jgi:hypothetical protein